MIIGFRAYIPTEQIGEPARLVTFMKNDSFLEYMLTLRLTAPIFFLWRIYIQRHFIVIFFYMAYFSIVVSI